MVKCPKCGIEYSLGRKIFHSCKEFSIYHGAVCYENSKNRPWNCNSITKCNQSKTEINDHKIVAFLGLNVDHLKMKSIAKKIASYDEVQLIAISSGDHDIVVLTIVKDEELLWKFINMKIRTLNGIKPKIQVSNFTNIYKSTLVTKYN